jgi:hypothetical protein
MAVGNGQLLARGAEGSSRGTGWWLLRFVRDPGTLYVAVLEKGAEAALAAVFVCRASSTQRSESGGYEMDVDPDWNPNSRWHAGWTGDEDEGMEDLPTRGRRVSLGATSVRRWGLLNPG